jgi:hypothetical protein
MADDSREIAERLRALGRGLSVQVPDDLAERVLVGISAVPLKRRTPWRPWASALAALIVAIAVSAGISAPVRAAIIHVFGFGGVEVREGPGPSPASSPVLPGEHRTGVVSAQREVGFTIRIPLALGQPDWVTVADGRVVSLHYLRPGGPVQIDQFEGNLGVMWEKFAMGPALSTTVDGHNALWFDDPVTLVYVDSTGLRRTESTRLTDGTLVWMDGGLTIRLDGVRPLDAALTVARSMS